LAWSPEHLDACEWLEARMRQEHLAVTRDAASNIIGRLGPTAGADRPAVLVGSHLDTVPEGGAYDGALGVLAGLCVARALSGDPARLVHPLWVAAFMDEEGVRFDTSFFGSRAFAGEHLPPLDRTDDAGTSLAEAIRAGGRDTSRLTEADEIERVLAYLELHIEQGPILAESGTSLGIVTDIVGRRVFSVRLSGEANHAGTTPRSHRRDALRGAATVTTRLHDAFDRLSDGTVNVAGIAAEPGAMNVIPGVAELDVEIRASTDRTLERAVRILREIVEMVALGGDLLPQVKLVDSAEPVSFDNYLVELLERTATSNGASWTHMTSGAGHDALVMAHHVPAGMLMVPSRNGVSHSPSEFTGIAECRLGTQVLTDAVRELTANGFGGHG
jgi:hydantoinase/carbamoylase family amidase